MPTKILADGQMDLYFEEAWEICNSKVPAMLSGTLKHLQMHS